MTFDREEVGRKIVETSQVCAEGYTRATSLMFQNHIEQETNKKCAIAASNTGWFILQALGFSKEETRAIVDAFKQEHPYP